MEYAGKVLIIVENLPVPFDTRVWQEANALTQAGYKVSIISPKGKGYDKIYQTINGISIYRHSMPPDREGIWHYMIEYGVALLWEFVLSWKVLRKEGFDVIHACNPPDDIFIIGLFFKLLGKKFIFDHHDINPELYIAKFGKKNVLYSLMLFMEGMTFRAADISLATNESYKEIAINRGKRNADNVYVVRSGPDLQRLKRQLPKENLKCGKRFLVGYVGVIGKQEGLDYLLEAVQYICREKKRRDILFVIIGGGPYLHRIKEKSMQMKIDNFIVFTGRVEDSVLLDYINTADICVNPDEYNEMNDKSTMNKILEYMALGKPIVQFDLKEGRYSAQDASLYAEKNNSIDFAEKMLYLLDNEEMRKKMSEYGLERIEKELQWDITKNALLDAYNGLFPSIREKRK